MCVCVCVCVCVCCLGVTHKQVVDFIRSGGHTLTLMVITLTQDEADRLEPQEEAASNFTFDYTERRSLPISIPEYKWVEKNGEKFTVFCIHMAGRHLCSRRYKQFDELHANLKREFCDFNFPKFPTKWPFTLSDQQTDSRRRKLEQWIERVCSVRVIADCELMQVQNLFGRLIDWSMRNFQKSNFFQSKNNASFLHPSQID